MAHFIEKRFQGIRFGSFGVSQQTAAACKRHFPCKQSEGQPLTYDILTDLKKLPGHAHWIRRGVPSRLRIHASVLFFRPELQVRARGVSGLFLTFDWYEGAFLSVQFG
jgi:hypothetical protein